MVEKVIEALEKREIKDFLLGNKDYAIVYPHFFDLLQTDIYSVLIAINEYCLINKVEYSYLLKELQAAFESLINNSEEFLYLLRYLRLYIEKKTEFTFSLDVVNIRESIIANKSVWTSLKNVEWEGYNLLELCNNCIYGFTAFDGSKVLGINDYFASMGIPLIPHFEDK